MIEASEQQCAQCGTRLLPGRRFCIACQTPVPQAGREPAGQIAELARQIPSTHRPDETLVFVPERRAARLQREGRRRRWLIANAVTVLVLTGIALGLWRMNERQQQQLKLKRRELMAQRELDRYAKALELFYADVGRYPTVQEGLPALGKRPPQLETWRGPYLDGDYSVDPWGNEYVYRVFGDGVGYELLTYGPEGEAGEHPLLSVKAGEARR